MSKNRGLTYENPLFVLVLSIIAIFTVPILLQERINEIVGSEDNVN